MCYALAVAVLTRVLPRLRDDGVVFCNGLRGGGFFFSFEGLKLADELGCLGAQLFVVLLQFVVGVGRHDLGAHGGEAHACVVRAQGAVVC